MANVTRRQAAENKKQTGFAKNRDADYGCAPRLNNDGQQRSSEANIMNSQRAAVFGLASIVTLILATPVFGDVLTAQPPVSGGGISRWSQLWQDPFGDNDLDGDSICWTDFTTSSPVSINHIEWWGEGACELGFQLEFWPQDPGTIAYQP